MSERKAINKYYPPDYDPSKVPKAKKSSNPNINRIRLMLPFSMKCVLCNEYIAARRKFNARKEVTAEKYLDVKIIRFHIKCPRCNSPLVFRTDPKSSGFEPVSGVVRNFVSSKTAEPEVPETEDQMLQRLENQERENQAYQEQRQKRKNNPFWRQAPSQPGSSLDAFEEKLLEQQKEQEMHDHLVQLQEKAAKLQNSGGADAAILKAQELVQKRTGHEFATSEKQRRKHPLPAPELARFVASKMIPKKILVKLGSLKKMRKSDSEISFGSTNSSLLQSSLSANVGTADKRASVVATNTDQVLAKTEEATDLNSETQNQPAKSPLILSTQSLPPNSALSASLGDYSSEEEDD